MCGNLLSAFRGNTSRVSGDVSSPDGWMALNPRFHLRKVVILSPVVMEMGCRLILPPTPRKARAVTPGTGGVHSGSRLKHFYTHACCCLLALRSDPAHTSLCAFSLLIFHYSPSPPPFFKNHISSLWSKSDSELAREPSARARWQQMSHSQLQQVARNVSKCLSCKSFFSIFIFNRAYIAYIGVFAYGLTFATQHFMVWRVDDFCSCSVILHTWYYNE